MKELITLERLKGALTSLTIWVNKIFLTLVSLYELFKEDLVLLKPYLPEELYQNLTMVLIVVNMLMRFRTTKDLAHK